ncbi:hypothetical protein [Caulobacter sp. LARHSG274]
MSDIWAVLGVSPVRDRDAIRRAYARRLKVTSPEDDAEAFATLRAAYEEALASLDWDWAWADDLPSSSERVPAEAAVAATRLHPDFGDTIVAIPGPASEDARGDAFGVSSANAALFLQLETLLREEPPPPPAAVEAAFDALLISPAFQEVATQVEVERRVLELIIDEIPRSDPLVRPAMKAFAWTRSGVISRRDNLVDAVLDRDSDIGFRRGLTSPGVQLHGAYKALTSPMGSTTRWQARLSPTLELDVRALFREIDTRRATLVADLNPDTYQWWRARLASPGLPAWTIWLVAGLPLLIALGNGLAQESGFAALGAWVGTQAAAIALAAYYVFGYARPRAWWQETWAWRSPLALRGGWAPAAWGLLLIAPVLPRSPWSLGLVGAAAAVILTWCLITGEPDRRTGTLPWPLRLLIVEIFVIIWWVTLGFDSAIDMSNEVRLAVVTAVLVSVLGSGSFIQIWYGELSDGGRQAAFVGLLVVFAAGVMFLLQDRKGAEGGLPLATASWITVLVMALRPAATALESASLRVRFYLIWPAVIGGRQFLDHITEISQSLLIGGLWMLVGAAITLILILRDIWPARAANR